jgi:hypothetical protein
LAAVATENAENGTENDENETATATAIANGRERVV